MEREKCASDAALMTERLSRNERADRAGKKATWTPERDAALESLLAQGYTYSQLAPKLGVSRNAAIGRAGRIGLRAARTPESAVDILSDGDRRQRRGACDRRDRARKAPAAGREAPSPGSPTPASTCEAGAGVVPLHVPFLEMQPGHCRYLYGDGPWTACGHPRVRHEEKGRSGYAGPYCAGHMRLTRIANSE
jgi:hypothetical protein